MSVLKTYPYRQFLLLMVLLSWVLSSCSKREVQVHQDSVFVFGTTVSITVADTDQATAEKVFKFLETDFQRMHVLWHAWRNGPLRRTNVLCSAGGTFTSAASIIDLVTKAKNLAIQSEHLFNPAIGKLIGLWGFHKDEYEDNFAPDPDQITPLVKSNPNMSQLDIKGVRFTCHNPDIQMDLGGIAKGFAMESSLKALQQQLPIRNILINAGGDIKSLGQKGSVPWRIGIRDPFATTRDAVIGSINLDNDMSVFTSGNYERYYEAEGLKAHHIIDPRTGYPAKGTAAVTVIHPDATTADAAATALFVAGKDEFARIARKMGIKHVLLITEDNKYYISRAMKQRVAFVNQPELIEVNLD